MRRILGASALVLGPAIVLLFAGGCGVGEGGRCQIDSDCADGLRCENGSTGNGTCTPINAVGSTPTDAAAKQDVLLSSGPDVEPEADTESPQVDTGAVVDLGVSSDTMSVADGGGATISIDATGSIDSL